MILPWSVLETTSPNPIEPITVDELLAIARVVAGDEELSLMPTYISAAREYIEKATGRTLISKSYRMTVDLSVLPDVVPLPYPPLLDIGAVDAIDADGEYMDISTDYFDERFSIPGALVWLSRPVLPREAVAWQIEFSSGHDAGSLISASLKRLVGVLAAHYLIAARDIVNVGTIVTTVPFAFDESLDPWRLVVIP